jgi:hypothetical protein
MAAYLKHIDTGEILPFNPDLATGEGMVPCDVNGNEESDAPPEPARAKSRKKAEEDLSDLEFSTGLTA